MKIKSVFTIVIAITLAAVMLCMPSLQSLAAELAPTYISDIEIGYGDSGKQALKDAGYTVWEELNANEGGNGSAVWIGYKTTLNADEAITDIATMNMTGGYSFEAYKDELEEISANVDYMLSNFKATILEFRANYNNGSEFAKAAYNMLNKITEDDTNKLMGDLLLDENTTDETLHTVFMQGNSEVLSYIYNALALGCTETSAESFITRLANAEYNADIDASGNRRRTQISNSITAFVKMANAAKSYHEEAEAAGGNAAYLETLDETEREEPAFYLSFYDVTSEIQYGNIAEILGVDSFSLLDALTLSTEYTSDDELYLDDAIIDMLAQAMTDGQIGCVSTVGIGTLVMNAYYAGSDADNKADYFKGIEETLKVLDGDDEISVYTFVDRTLFSDVDSVALTSAALREKAAKDGSDFGKKKVKDWRDSMALKITLTALAVVSGAVAVYSGLELTIAKEATTIVTSSKFIISEASGYSSGIYQEFASRAEACDFINKEFYSQGNYELELYPEEVITETTVPAYSAGFIKGLTVVTTVAAIAFLVLTIMSLITFLHQPEETVDYKKIPRVLVDVRYDDDGDKDYYNYYAAKLVTAEEGETDSLKLYGDLNGLNKKDQWDVLYFSKDSRLGNGLTTDILVKSDVSNLTLSETNDYKAIHSFDSLGAANLNKYNTSGSAKKIYVLVKAAADTENANTNTETASVFSKSTIITSVITLIAGAGLATLATALVMKKKKA